MSQGVKRLLQDGVQGRVSHVLQDLQCQVQLSLQGLGALVDLSKETGERACEGPGVGESREIEKGTGQWTGQGDSERDRADDR